MGTEPPSSDSVGQNDDSTRTIHLANLARGEEIGPYKLLRQLGEGGMGVVYHALQLQPIQRDVALKIIKPGMDSRQVVARFESERQALAIMDHPNIAHVLDAGATAAGLPYFVMELVDGIPITRYCDQKRLTLKQRIELFIPVSRAIQHAHQKGIIHRDIKPSNILVIEQEGRPVPKVIDFGLAKALGPQISDATMMTNLGTVLGTLDYMSPEQADFARRDVDTRSDIYSLGAVLYELLTGSTPLERGRLAKAGYVETLQRIRDEDTPPPSVRLRHSTTSAEIAEERQIDRARLPNILRGELDWIIMRALEKDRARRYETANGLARDLERYLTGEPVEAAPPSARYRMLKFVRRHRLGLGVAAGFATLLTAGVVVSAWLAIQASRAEQESKAVNDFLRNDLLAQASATTQARPDNSPNPNLTVRAALDRAASRIEGKFGAQPLVEASIRETIGETYIDLSRYTEAELQLRRAFEIRQRILGEKNPYTLESMNGVATALERQGRYADAEHLYQRVLDARQRVLGAENAATLSTMSGLVATYLGEGKYDAAEAVFTRLIPSQGRVLGEENDGTLRSMGNLAAMYHLQHKYGLAEPLYLKTLSLRRRASGAEHPETLLVLVNLAELYRDQGRYSEAQPLYAGALEIETRVLGEGSRKTIYCMNGLAGLYRNEGQYAQAESLYSRAVQAEKNGIGENHPYSIETSNGLVRLYDEWGKPDKAAEWRSRLKAGAIEPK